MDFEVFIHPKIYNTIPDERRKQMLSEILGLCDPFLEILSPTDFQ